jgi:murein DD-endopeptidase MepM/ murein hydrolase activator NlpD
VIALIGNSGNSDEPHLHIQAQNSATFGVLKPPANLMTYPLLFDDMVVKRNGSVQQPDLADLRRGDTFQRLG